MIDNGFVEYVLECLAPLGGMRAKKMFGGYGIYKKDTIFGLIADDILYFKIDDSNRADYEAFGSKPFTYEGKNNKQVSMSYWQLPIDILEKHEQLELWVNKALKASLASKKPKKLS